MTEEEIDERSDFQLAALIEAVHAVMGKREVAVIAKLSDRCYRQAREIANLTKHLKSARDQAGWRGAVSKIPEGVGVGSVVVDGYGRTFTVQFMAEKGFIDERNEKHDWSAYGETWKVVQEPAP